MSTHMTALIDEANTLFVGTYSRFPAVMVRGEGCRLWDMEGREYLDFLAGIAVCALGHCHPAVTAAVRRQAGELVHVSNLFYMRPQIELARLLIRHSFAERVFFANSGAEANEAAIKLARIASPPARYEVISLAGSFHGRTLATVAATGQQKFHQGFEPMPQGFVHAEFGDLADMERLVSERSCAVLCEPLQGESGVRPLSPEYLRGIRALCDRHGLLLIFDEVQTGLGRTGTVFAYEQLGVTPDIMTLAKGLGNGLPIGAMLTTNRLASAMSPGSHASTFGGNPVAAAAAVVTLETILAPGFLDEVQAKGRYFQEGLQQLAERFPALATATRGMGFILGLVLSEAGRERGMDMVRSMYDRGLLANFAGGQVLRFLPPLIVSREEIDHALAVVAEVLAEASGQ